MQNQSEHEEQMALFRWADLHKNKYPALGTMFAIPNGGHRHIAVAKKLKAEGVKAGIPDIFLPAVKKWDIKKNEDLIVHGLFIEMKTAVGRASELQLSWASKLEYAGYKVAICKGWIAAVFEIIDYLGLPENLKPSTGGFQIW